MVQCSKIDGEPCKCELVEPCVNYLVETLTSNILKLVLRTITPFELNELHEFTHMPDARRYLELYTHELDKQREVIDDAAEPYIDYVVGTIVGSILKYVLKTITPTERIELHEFSRVTNARGYIDAYLGELDNHREIIGDIVLNTI